MAFTIKLYLHKCVFVCLLFQKLAVALDQDRILINKPASNWNQQNELSPDEVIRCYCNLPSCVATGYMCRSERGGCFSDIPDRDPPPRIRQDVYRARHGCLELLKSQDLGSQCQNSPSSSGASTSPSGQSEPYTSGRSLLLCCFKDMCNHVDTLDNSRKILINENVTGVLNNSDSQAQTPLPSPGYNSNEVWFKAATIAVPICGALILFMLIALAVKILRTDGLDTPSVKLGGHYTSSSSERKTTLDNAFEQYHQPSSSLKRIPLLLQHCDSGASVITSCTNHSSDYNTQQTSVPLLVQNQTRICYDKKNEANAKLNLVSNLEYTLLPQSQINIDEQRSINIHKPCNTNNINIPTPHNMYRNVNLSTAPNHNSNEEPKLYHKQMTWEQTNPVNRN